MPQTTNYSLPTFGASDAVNLLITYNQAMATIDAQMKANADAASAADVKAGTAQTAANSAITRIGTLESTVGSASSGLVKDVNDLKTTVGSATSGLVKEVNSLSSDVSQNASDIAALDTRIDNLEGIEFNPQPSTDAKFDVTKLANARIDKNGIVYFKATS